MATTLPRLGFSLAESGRTMPLLVLLSASTRLTRILSPRGRSFAMSTYSLSGYWDVLRGPARLPAPAHLSLVTRHWSIAGRYGRHTGPVFPELARDFVEVDP